MIKNRTVILISLLAFIGGVTIGYYSSKFTLTFKNKSSSRYANISTNKPSSEYTNISAWNKECWQDVNKKFLDAKMEQSKKLNEAIGNIRKLSLSKPGSCNNNPNSIKPHGKTLDLIVSGGYTMPELISSIVEVNANTYQIFDEEIAIKVESLVSMLQQNMDYCSKDFPSSEKLTNIQKDINADMDKLINITKQKLGVKE